jgi:hypothetical protein
MRLRIPVIHFKTVEIGGRRHTNYSVSQPRRRGRKLYIIGLILLLAVGASGFIWHNLKAPSEGQVALTNPDNSPHPKVSEYQTLETQYYSLNYSGSYTQQPTDLPPAGIIDHKVLSYPIADLSDSSTITVDIKAAPDGGITLDSTYDYYLKHQSQFSLSNKFYHSEAVDIARNKKGMPETTAMWLHGSFLMIIKLTTPSLHQDIDSELTDILASVQWRQ